MLDRVRLAKVLELLGSPVDGERLAATEKANLILRQAQTTWTELILGGAESQPRARPSRTHEDETYRDLAEAILNDPAYKPSSPREAEFVEHMTEWDGPVTEKQRKWIDNIMQRMKKGAA